MLSVTAQYALRATTHIAQRGCWCTAKEVSFATGIPGGYVAKILSSLCNAGILVSQRGLNGGFQFNRDPDEVSAFAIVRAIDPPSSFSTCSSCRLGNPQTDCSVNRLLVRIQSDEDHALRQTSLSSLLCQCSSIA
ncbi:MAG: Rrf2 family transcriptional regulator [Planctomycetes bacterium]|nr:Rrf2 family transcriptional regulator [Planctomycetota bacterium]